MNFEWRRWFTSVQSAYSICATSCGFSQRHSAILSAVRPWPHPALVALGQVRKGAGLDFERVETLENPRPKSRDKPVSDARNVDEVVALVIADDERVEGLTGRDIAADHKLLSLVNAHSYPSTGAPAGPARRDYRGAWRSRLQGFAS